MNKRIKELAEQSGWTEGYYESDGPFIEPEFNKEKFAELIVKECMSMCDERRAVYFGHRMASDDFIDKNMYAEGETACDAIRYKIKQHFGVEE